MLRRNLSWLRVVTFVIVIGLLVVGFYNFQDLQRQVRTAEEREETVKNQLDSASNQLEVLFQQKRDLEITLGKERKEHQKVVDDLRKQVRENETKFMQDKTVLMQRLTAVTTETKQLQGRIDDLETDLSQLREKNNEVVKEKQTVEDRFEKEYMALKQDRDDKVTQLRDQVNALQSRLGVYETQLRDANQRKITLEDELKDAKQQVSDLQAWQAKVQADADAKAAAQAQGRGDGQSIDAGRRHHDELNPDLLKKQVEQPMNELPVDDGVKPREQDVKGGNHDAAAQRQIRVKRSVVNNAPLQEGEQEGDAAAQQGSFLPNGGKLLQVLKDSAIDATHLPNAGNGAQNAAAIQPPVVNQPRDASDLKNLP